jgi:hypothetical protein
VLCHCCSSDTAIKKELSSCQSLGLEPCIMKMMHAHANLYISSHGTDPQDSLVLTKRNRFQG